MTSSQVAHIFGSDESRLVRALSDTVWFCRDFLGMDSDRLGEETTNRGEGGVRDYGPHRDFCNVLDDPSIPLFLALMPRNTYKSSIVMGRILREILSNPNSTILLCMHDKEVAAKRTQVIRDQLMENELIRSLFGDVRGPEWKKDRFTTKLRTNRTLLDPTMMCCSRDSLVTGGHFSLILMDDIIDMKSSKTEDAIQNSIRAVRYFMPLRTLGGKLGDIGTLYVEGDVHHYLMEQREWKKVVHEVGYELEEDKERRLVVTGECTNFPFLTKQFLQEQLSVMGPRVWLSQYKNRLVGVGNEVFNRESFQPMSWRNEMRNLTGYLLTDTASSEKKEGCFNVLLYVGLDEQLRAYILDCQIGHWGPDEFVNRFFLMKEKWETKLTHQGEGWEVTTLNYTYRSLIEKRSRETKSRINLLEMPRNSNDQSKDQRILRLQPKFAARDVFVVNTVPREFIDLGDVKVLWDPEGYQDPRSKTRYPGGELVRQFIAFRPWGKSIRDIPDAMAMIDEIDPKTHTRFCFYRRPSHLGPPEDTIRRKSSPVRTGNPLIYRKRRRR